MMCFFFTNLQFVYVCLLMGHGLLYLRIGPAVVPGLGSPVLGAHGHSQLENGREHHVCHHPTTESRTKTINLGYQKGKPMSEASRGREEKMKSPKTYRRRRSRRGWISIIQLRTQSQRTSLRCYMINR